jgi:hypothetical protein
LAILLSRGAASQHTEGANRANRRHDTGKIFSLWAASIGRLKSEVIQIMNWSSTATVPDRYRLDLTPALALDWKLIEIPSVGTFVSDGTIHAYPQLKVAPKGIRAFIGLGKIAGAYHQRRK